MTLFIEHSNDAIEKTRDFYNPEEFELSAAHITLCCEDELEPIDIIIERIKSMNKNIAQIGL